MQKAKVKWKKYMRLLSVSSLSPEQEENPAASSLRRHFVTPSLRHPVTLFMNVGIVLAPLTEPVELPALDPVEVTLFFF